MDTNKLRKLIALDELIECPDCHGTGVYHHPNGQSWTCQECDGEGEVNKSIYDED